MRVKLIFGSSVSISQVEARLNFLSLLRRRPRFDLGLESPRLLIERDPSGISRLPFRPRGIGEGLEFPSAGHGISLGEVRAMDCSLSQLSYKEARIW